MRRPYHIVKVPDELMAETPNPLPPLIGDAKSIAFAELHRRLAETGHPRIRDGHGCVFRFIDTEGTRLTALAERSGLTKQAVGEAVDDLEGMGYVERVSDPADRRAKIIRLTRSGADAQQVALGIFDAIERDWEQRFGKQRIAILREVLTEIVESERSAVSDSVPAGVGLGGPAPVR
jgi:DNA-binding MarR family transcriptional regulator